MKRKKNLRYNILKKRGFPENYFVITRKLRMHIPVEQVLEEFAETGSVRGCKKLCDSICNSEEKWRGYDRDYP